MVKYILILSIAIFTAFTADAQNMRKRLKKRTAEVGVYGNLGYYGNPHWGFGSNIQYLHGIGRKRQTFSVGAGLRANVFNTKRRNYTSSSAYLNQINPGGADTMYVPKVQTNSLNAYLAIKIHIKRGVDIFINSDIGGLNFGDSKTNYFRSYETNPLPPGTPYKMEPYAFNLNTLNSDSYGTLMSEIYGSFRLNNVLKWRLGFNYLRNEYKADRQIPLNGKRFSQYNWMVMSGIAFDIRWHKTVANYEWHP